MPDQFEELIRQREREGLPTFEGPGRICTWCGCGLFFGDCSCWCRCHEHFTQLAVKRREIAAKYEAWRRKFPAPDPKGKE